MAIPIQSIKKLYALSAGLCNICKASLFENDVHIGEMAHVIAQSPYGPRGNESVKNRDTYENLILLCANHHTTVDQNLLVYTDNELRRIKNDHESHIEFSIQRPNTRNGDIKSLNAIMRFCPFTRLSGYLQYLPGSFNIDFFSLGDIVESFRIDNPHCLPLSDPQLDAKFSQLIQVHSRLMGLLNGSYKNIAIYNSCDNQIKRAFFNGKAFSFEDREHLKREIESVKSVFIESYCDFINFVRASYSEVILDSYSV